MNLKYYIIQAKYNKNRVKNLNFLVSYHRNEINHHDSRADHLRLIGEHKLAEKHNKHAEYHAKELQKLMS